MNYKIFLDDERDVKFIYPKSKVDEYKIARSFDDFLSLILDFGLPNFISFDHDLGVDDNGNLLKTGFDIAKFIVQNDLDGSYQIPFDFKFTVHSSNPAGRDNIQGLLDNYLEFKKK